MFAVITNQHSEVVSKTNTFTIMPRVFEFQPDRELDKWLVALSPDTPWGERQIAAQKLGHIRDSQALPGLLAALPDDPFWMVRCAIIQALETINDARAIPTLREVAKSDGFQVVRSYAARAVERLLREG